MGLVPDDDAKLHPFSKHRFFLQGCRFLGQQNSTPLPAKQPFFQKFSKKRRHAQ